MNNQSINMNNMNNMNMFQNMNMNPNMFQNMNMNQFGNNGFPNQMNMNQNNMFGNGMNMNQNNNMFMQNFNNNMMLFFMNNYMQQMMNNNINNNNMQNNNFMNNNNNNFMNNNMNNNFNNNNNNRTNNNQNEAPKENLPRVEKFLQFNDYPNLNEWEKINIHLHASSGLKIMLSVPKYMPVKDMFLLYTKKIGISDKLLGKEIIFLFNANTIDIHCTSPISEIIPNLGVVTVIDRNNVIGAK